MRLPSTVLRARCIGLLVPALSMTTGPLALAQGKAAPATSASAAPGKPAVKSEETSRAERVEQARLLFAAAEEKLAAGDFAGALEGYKSANALARSPQAFLRIAMCLDEMGSRVEAAAAYHRFLGLPPPEAMAEEKRAAEARVADGEKGTLRVTSVQPSVVVEIDGAAAAPTPAELRVLPGPHTIRASAPHYETGIQTIEVKVGETIELAIALAPLPPPPSAPASVAPITAEPPPKESARPTRRVAYAVWGLAIAAGGVGTYYGLRALKAKSDYDAAPTQELADRARDSSGGADVGLGLAVLLGITGGVIFAYSDDAPDRRAASRTVRVAPIVGPKTQGASLAFSF